MKKHIWTANFLIEIGKEAWEEGKLGHSLLLIIGSQIDLKIGTLLKLTWNDLIEFEKEQDWRESIKIKGQERQPNENLGAFIRTAYEFLNPNKEDVVFQNYSLGNPLNTANLNKELKQLTDKYLDRLRKHIDEVKITHTNNSTGEVTTEMEMMQYVFNSESVKTKDIEFGWARDEIKSRGFTKKAYIEISRILRHKNTQYTIDALGLEVRDRKEIKYNHREENENMNELINEIENQKKSKIN